MATAGEGAEARSTLGLPPRGGKWRAEEVNDQEKEMGNVDMRGVGRWGSRLTRRILRGQRQGTLGMEAEHGAPGREARGPRWRLERGGVETLSTRGRPPEGGGRRNVGWTGQRGTGRVG